MWTYFNNFIFKIIFVVILPSARQYYYEDDYNMHPRGETFSEIRKRSLEFNRITTRDDVTANYWHEKGQEAVLQRLRRKLNKNVAKNVILFLGDGMSIPTLAATRAYSGGIDSSLSFENFPYSALSKTYCLDRQVADSACSSTAYLGGVKANYGTLGVTGQVRRSDCAQMTNASNFVESIAHFAQIMGKSTGLVTTSRVTHASPAGLYAHTAERDWESDFDVMQSGNDPQKCPDIATQLVRGRVGRNFNVILGGGRQNFLPANCTDHEGQNGRRFDGINLIDEWLQLKLLHGNQPRYVWNRTQLLEAVSNDSTSTDILGLFNGTHLDYNLNRNKSSTPSLAEMTESAITHLMRKRSHDSDLGFFLFVEGAKIDMAHHETKAKKALDETLEFSKAVQRAVDLTDEKDTLIVVTADHAHTLSYSGYADRKESIFGTGGNDLDNLPYRILNYANGPSAHLKKPKESHDIIYDMDYQFPGIYPMVSETHGGDDVAIFAKGPWSHLFTGVMEQNVIPQLMEFAACLGDGAKSCDAQKSP